MRNLDLDYGRPVGEAVTETFHGRAPNEAQRTDDDDFSIFKAPEPYGEPYLLGRPEDSLIGQNAPVSRPEKIHVPAHTEMLPERSRDHSTPPRQRVIDRCLRTFGDNTDVATINRLVDSHDLQTVAFQLLWFGYRDLSGWERGPWTAFAYYVKENEPEPQVCRQQRMQRHIERLERDKNAAEEDRAIRMTNAGLDALASLTEEEAELVESQIQSYLSKHNASGIPRNTQCYRGLEICAALRLRGTYSQFSRDGEE